MTDERKKVQEERRCSGIVASQVAAKGELYIT